MGLADQVRSRNSGNANGKSQPAPASLVSRFVSRFSCQPVAAKVPEITALFWLVKLLTTAGGEATSDYLGNFNVVIGSVVEIGVFAVALWWQFRTRRYFARVLDPGLRHRHPRHRCVGHPSLGGRHPLRRHQPSVGNRPRGRILAVEPKRGHVVDPQRHHPSVARATTGPLCSPPSRWARPWETSAPPR